MSKKVKLALAGVPAFMAATGAHAAGVDVTEVVTKIGEQAGPIGLIGGAVLLIVVAVAAFKWVRGALR